MDRLVIDTNIFVSALLNADNASRQIVRLALTGEVQSVFGAALLAEHEDVLSRETLFRRCPLDAAEREALFDALLSVSEWVRIHFLWRPNLPDEADNHVVELAVAAAASAIITANQRDFVRAELVFPELKVLNAKAYLTWRRRQ